MGANMKTSGLGAAGGKPKGNDYYKTVFNLLKNGQSASVVLARTGTEGIDVDGVTPRSPERNQFLGKYSQPTDARDITNTAKFIVRQEKSSGRSPVLVLKTSGKDGNSREKIVATHTPERGVTAQSLATRFGLEAEDFKTETQTTPHFEYEKDENGYPITSSAKRVSEEKTTLLIYEA